MSRFKASFLFCTQTYEEQVLEVVNILLIHTVIRSSSVLLSGRHLFVVLTISCNYVLCPVLAAALYWNCDVHVSLFRGRTGQRRTGVSCLVKILIIISTPDETVFGK